MPAGGYLEDVLADVCPSCRLAAARPRVRPARPGRPGRAGRLRTLAVAVRTALQLLAARGSILVAVDDVQWLDPSSAGALAFALRRLAEEDIRILLARRLGDAIAVSELEHALDESRTTRLRIGPLSAGALHGILQRQLGRGFARPTLLRLHGSSGGNHSSRSSSPARSVRTAGGRSDAAAACRRRSGCSSMRGSTRCRSDRHGSPVAGIGAPDARTPSPQNRRSRARAGVRGGRDRRPMTAPSFTHPLLASGLYRVLPTRAPAGPPPLPRSSTFFARARHLTLAAEGQDAEIAVELEAAATRCDCSRRSDRRR